MFITQQVKTRDSPTNTNKSYLVAHHTTIQINDTGYQSKQRGINSLLQISSGLLPLTLGEAEDGTFTES
jgi:hypothetical protein